MEPSKRVRLVRQRSRASYDRADIDAILDEGLVAHLAFVLDDQPYVLPTLHARVGDRVYVHGSSASRMLRHVGRGNRACLTVTVFDGLVLARSVFEHDVNYRSVVLLGELRAAGDASTKSEALHAFTERLLPGRWEEARTPSPTELKATSILWLEIDEASAKLGTDGPSDADGPDGELDVWAGTLPAVMRFGKPIPDPGLRPGIPLSPAAAAFLRARR